jgi:hypothetical protein
MHMQLINSTETATCTEEPVKYYIILYYMVNCVYPTVQLIAIKIEQIMTFLSRLEQTLSSGQMFDNTIFKTS